MKPLLLLAILVVSFVFFETTSANPPEGPNMNKANPEIYGELRNQLLQGSRKAFNLPPSNDPKEPWAVIMEIGFPEGSATIVALVDGSASIYLSSGGGSIGGGAHESIRKAAIGMVNLAAKYLPRMAATKEFPLPKNGQTIFYVLTDAGTFTASAPENDLGENHHFLSLLFYAGQEIITQYRLIEDKPDTAKP
jgi:hypothetical protein